MAKINIKTILNTSDNIIENNIKGIYLKDKITYKENGINVVINMSKTNISLKRENKDYKLILNFNELEKSKGIYLLKEYNKLIEINIRTSQVIIEANKINIKYQSDLDDNNINFTLEYEVIS